MSICFFCITVCYFSVYWHFLLGQHKFLRDYLYPFTPYSWVTASFLRSFELIHLYYSLLLPCLLAIFALDIQNTPLNMLADINSAVVWIASILLISNPPTLFQTFRHRSNISITFIFQFFLYLWQGQKFANFIFLNFFWFSLDVLPGGSNPMNRTFFSLQINIRLDFLIGIGYPFVTQNARENYASRCLEWILVCVYIIW